MPTYLSFISSFKSHKIDDVALYFSFVWHHLSNIIHFLLGWSVNHEILFKSSVNISLYFNATTDALFSNKKTEENGLKSFVSIIGGSEKVAEIKKVFGFDVVEALKALLNYERKTNVQGKSYFLYE